MKRRFSAGLVIGIVIGGFAVAGAGCEGSGPAMKRLVTVSDSIANQTVGPRFLEYVAADDTLTDATKQTYTDEVTTWRDAVEAAQNEIAQQPQ